jgi:hypothetical protein
VHTQHVLDKSEAAYKLWPEQVSGRIRDKDRALGWRGFAKV